MTAAVGAAPPGSTALAPRVAFQGEFGAYSDQAVAAWSGGAATPVPARACADVARLVAAGEVEYGLLAVENTLAGSVAAAYDAIAAAPGLVVVGEVVLPIHHCVLAPAGATLAGLTAVESHPVALAQCQRFFDAHPHVEPRAAYDTAGAARAAAARGDVRVGAIAGRAAARRFGLTVLAADVEDRPDNQTRFYAVARAGEAPDVGLAARARDGAPSCTALLAEAENVPGTLLGLLAPVAAAGLNLSKLESRPTGVPWRYRFVLELEHDAGDSCLGPVLDAVRARAEVRVLGTFARASRAAAGPEVSGV